MKNTNYQSVFLIKDGIPEVLKKVSNSIPRPKECKVQVKIKYVGINFVITSRKEF